MNKIERFFLCRQCYSFEPYDGVEFKSCSKCDLSSFLNVDNKPLCEPIKIIKFNKIEGYSYKKSINHNILLLNKFKKSNHI